LHVALERHVAGTVTPEREDKEVAA